MSKRASIVEVCVRGDASYLRPATALPVTLLLQAASTLIAFCVLLPYSSAAFLSLIRLAHHPTPSSPLPSLSLSPSPQTTVKFDIWDTAGQVSAS